MLKVLLLADANSAHTQKWALALAQKGIEIGIFSLREPFESIYKGQKNVRIFTAHFKKGISNTSGFFKISYLKALPALKKVISEFKPDIVHAHYATSYGFLGTLSGFHPFVISVWGSDVYDFPKKSFLHRYLLKHNLRKADKILSTSNVMAVETGKYTAKGITVIPFGIDSNVFKPGEKISLFTDDDTVIGTVKMLEEKYGIEYLIRAFSIVKKRNPRMPLKLLIVGSGSLLDKLKLLAKNSGVESDALFTGFVEWHKIPAYHNAFSIEVFPSISDSESFGVSVLEASACGKPVIVSNVGGLPEVVEDNVTGIIVPPRSPEMLANAIEKLVLDEKLRVEMGKKGRARVEKLYNWEANVAQMIDIYNKLGRRG